MITIICSSLDAASQNIKTNLLSLEKWNKISDGVFETEIFRLVEINEPLLYQDGIDAALESRGYKSGLLVFASKHSSEAKRSGFLAHFTGNVSDAKFGGSDRELAMAAPHALRSVLVRLKQFSDEVTMECTHHGPSHINTPSLFVEIGSTEKEWSDSERGAIVAKAILSLDEAQKYDKVLVGFGG